MIKSPLVTVDGLIFDYTNTRALRSVSFAVQPGSITALVGPNGAGKTTLMRCIAALEIPVAGAITLDGIDIAEYPREAHARIGFLQDFFGLYEDLTIRQCLTYHAAARSVPKSEQVVRIDEIASLLNIDLLLDKKTGALSRGQRQRVAIAQAIIHKPQLVLLDEPAAGLDPEARVGLSRLIVGLRDQGMTLIVSSHILAELEDYSTDLMILRDGRVLDYRPIQLYTDTLQKRRLALILAEKYVSDSETVGLLKWLKPDKTPISLHDFLQQHQSISAIEQRDDRIEFDFSGDVNAQSVLLRGLIENRIPVASLSEIQVSMQDLYLAHLKEDKVA